MTKITQLINSCGKKPEHPDKKHTQTLGWAAVDVSDDKVVTRRSCCFITWWQLKFTVVLRITIRGNKQIGGNVLKKTVWGLSRQILSVIRSATEQAAYFLSYSGQTGAPGGKTQADTGETDKTSDRQKKAEKPVFSAVNHWTIVLPSEDLWGFCWHNTRSLENHA